MTDIHTIEGREKLRQVLGTPGSLYSPKRRRQMLDTVQPALDGLDIAEEMAKHIEHHPMTASGRCTECKRLSRCWEAWKRGK